MAVAADEKDDLAPKQKAFANGILKKCDVSNAALVETSDLFVTGPIPPEKLKPMAENLQKQYATILKSLRFEMTENPPKGRLTVYLLPDRKQLSAFVGEIGGERLDRGARAQSDSKGTEPYVAVSVLPGEKPTDLEAEASSQIALVLLFAKAGTTGLPGWLQEGFVRATRLRADPKAAVDRTRVKTLLYDTKARPSKYKVQDAWTISAEKDRQLITASLVEYLIYGQPADKAGKFLAAFRVPEDDPKPSIATVLMAIDHTPDTLDAAWKKWVMTGK
jgi:hypothetical protein